MPPKRRNGPAHQNTFAFRHNPHSKLTKQILAAPNVHVCRRCHDKIEWRKQYRKYKTRTQPGKCNACQLKRVTAAYHTICEPCTRLSAKAKSVLDEWNSRGAPVETEADKPSTASENGSITENDNQITLGEQVQIVSGTEAASDSVVNEELCEVTPAIRVYRRVCAICVKEPALGAEQMSDYQEDPEITRLRDLDRPLKLREVKRLERQVEKKSSRRRRSSSASDEEEDDDNAKENDEEKDGSEVENVDNEDEEDEELDPFLQAVGGADKLLTGEAYQAKLLQQQAEQAATIGLL